MYSLQVERRILQTVIAVLALVPVGAGLAGVILGPGFSMRSEPTAIDLDSHGRYLSGLLLAIGLGFWVSVPSIETSTNRIRLLASIVVIGGVGRLLSVAVAGVPSTVMLGALVMELAVTPALAVWQNGFAARFSAAEPIAR